MCVFNGGEILFRGYVFTRGSLNRISALGVDGGVRYFSLESLEEIYSSFLVYKTRVMDILHRLLSF